jgi:hypothetical protein
VITYLIRQDSNVKYTISKWNMTKEPVEVYTVYLGQRPKCNCPAGHNHKHCKHTGMVKSWIAKGMLMEELQ